MNSLLSDYNGIVHKNAAEALKIFQEKDIISSNEGGQVIVIKDSIIQRSTISAGAPKCPDCGREVDANEKFCPECGARL